MDKGFLTVSGVCVSFMQDCNSVSYCISGVGALLTPITHDTPTQIRCFPEFSRF